MRMNQNETAEMRKASRVATQHQAAFTLTELLVVITIIAVLAGLITGAAMNALRKAKETAITVEIQQLATAMEDFKNQHGAYPPNVYNNSDSIVILSNQEKQKNASDLSIFMKRVAPRSTEFQSNLANPNNRGNPALSDNLHPIFSEGISPAEAIVFWLGGFSADVARPLTGSDLIPSAGSGLVTIDSRTPLYDFDRKRLRPTRTLRFFNTADQLMEIQLYEYLADGSQEPFIYFDTSRRKPSQVVQDFPHNPNPPTIPGHEIFFKPSSGDGCVVPLKQPLSDAPNPPVNLNQVEYVNQRKFQILHCGIDDAWGNLCFNESNNLPLMQLNSTDVPSLLFPSGPFLGEISDNVGNFSTSNLADAQEE